MHTDYKIDYQFLPLHCGGIYQHVSIVDLSWYIPAGFNSNYAHHRIARFANIEDMNLFKIVNGNAIHYNSYVVADFDSRLTHADVEELYK